MIPSFLMIPLSLISAFLLFHGAFFRYSAHIALTSGLSFTASLLIALFSGAFSAGSMNLSALAAYIQNLPTLLVLGIPAGAVILCILVMKFVRKASPILIILFSSHLPILAVASLFSRNVSPLSLLIGSLVSSALLLLLLFKWRVPLLITSSSVAGAYALAALFSLFYYFTPAVSITLFIILLFSGAAVQNSTRKKAENRAAQEKDKESPSL